VTKRACLDCARPIDSGRRRCEKCESKRFYASRDPLWRVVRAARLELDGHRCQLRFPGCTGRATSVHLAEELGSDHRRATVENTLSACAHCHGVKHAPKAMGSRQREALEE
jgi:DNA-directed RNA polymerase subunit RPC12/RpoP